MVGGVQFPLLAPLEIIEHDTIAHLVRQGYLVIACGGGGIPVVRDGQQLKGVEAVIDKDPGLRAARQSVRRRSAGDPHRCRKNGD